MASKRRPLTNSTPSRSKRSKVKDSYCWVCHKDDTDFDCVACIRSYHKDCVGLKAVPDTYKCDECLKVDVSRYRFVNMNIDEERLNALLELTTKRLLKDEEFNSFDSEFFKKNQRKGEQPRIINILGLDKMADKVKERKYNLPIDFLADIGWICHNLSIVSPIASNLRIAKRLFDFVQKEVYDIETCQTCYERANEGGDWFLHVCDPPHMLVWARESANKPHKPAKLMATLSSDKIDVRFFDDFRMAQTSAHDCYVYSGIHPLKPQKETPRLTKMSERVDTYIHNMKVKFGAFEKPKTNIPIDLTNFKDQLKTIVPEVRLPPNHVLPSKSAYLLKLTHRKSINTNVSAEQRASFVMELQNRASGISSTSNGDNDVIAHSQNPVDLTNDSVDVKVKPLAQSSSEGVRPSGSAEAVSDPKEAVAVSAEESDQNSDAESDDTVEIVDTNVNNNPAENVQPMEVNDPAENVEPNKHADQIENAGQIDDKPMQSVDTAKNGASDEVEVVEARVEEPNLIEDDYSEVSQLINDVNGEVPVDSNAHYDTVVVGSQAIAQETGQSSPDLLRNEETLVEGVVVTGTEISANEMLRIQSEYATQRVRCEPSLIDVLAKDVSTPDEETQLDLPEQITTEVAKTSSESMDPGESSEMNESNIVGEPIDLDETRLLDETKLLDESNVLEPITPDEAIVLNDSIVAKDNSFSSDLDPIDSSDIQVFADWMNRLPQETNEQIASLENQLNTAQKAIQELQLQNTELGKLNAELHASKETLENELNATRQANKELKTRNADLDKLIADKVASNETSLKEIIEMEEEEILHLKYTITTQQDQLDEHEEFFRKAIADTKKTVWCTDCKKIEAIDFFMPPACSVECFKRIWIKAHTAAGEYVLNTSNESNECDEGALVVDSLQKSNDDDEPEGTPSDAGSLTP